MARLKPKYGLENNPNLSQTSATQLFLFRRNFSSVTFGAAVKFYLILLPLGLFTTIAAIKSISVHQNQEINLVVMYMYHNFLKIYTIFSTKGIYM